MLTLFITSAVLLIVIFVLSELRRLHWISLDTVGCTRALVVVLLSAVIGGLLDFVLVLPVWVFYCVPIAGSGIAAPDRAVRRKS